LKKRTKKLLFLEARPHGSLRNGSFLLLFFKKEEEHLLKEGAHGFRC
jgi:hypothetical protein